MHARQVFCQLCPQPSFPPLRAHSLFIQIMYRILGFGLLLPNYKTIYHMVYTEKFADPSTKVRDQCARAYGVGSEEGEIFHGVTERSRL